VALLGELRAGFPWGVLLLTDEDSTEAIPTWTSDDEQVTNSATAAVVRVMHRDEGDVTVRVWDDESAASGGLVFTGAFALESGVLIVSDAEGESILRVPVGVGLASVEVYIDAPVEASHVDVVVTQRRTVTT
jgi:hypothetical protein